MRMLGVKLGKNVVSINFRLVHIEDAHLVTIGNGCFLSACTLSPQTITHDGRHFKFPITLDSHCSVGFRTVVEGHVTMESCSALGWMTYVKGTNVRPYRVQRANALLGHHMQGRRLSGMTMLQRQQVIDTIKVNSCKMCSLKLSTHSYASYTVTSTTSLFRRRTLVLTSTRIFVHGIFVLFEQFLCCCCRLRLYSPCITLPL